MDKLCCDCEHLNRNDTYKDWYTQKITYKCKEKCCYKKLDDHACSSFKELRTTGSYTPSGCYITTIICDILGYEDNCELLTILRNFRDNTLKKDPKYLALLLEYDKIGPMISQGIHNEKNNDRFCLGLMQYFLIPCANLIKEEKIDEAVDAYKNMVMYLNDEFELPTIVIDMNEEYDLELIGKGRIRTTQTSEC